jgi:hypothetical protein
VQRRAFFFAAEKLLHTSFSSKLIASAAFVNSIFASYELTHFLNPQAGSIDCGVTDALKGE